MKRDTLREKLHFDLINAFDKAEELDKAYKNGNMKKTGRKFSIKEFENATTTVEIVKNEGKDKKEDKKEDKSR